MMNRKGLLVGTVIVLVVLTSTAQAVLPVSYQTCGVCGYAFEEKAQEQGINLTVKHSTANVTIHQDGDSSWRVTNRVTNQSDIERLSSEPGVLYEIISTSAFSLPPKTNPTNVSANITSQGVITITFEHSGFARQMPGGILLTDYFHTYGNYYHNYTADRFTVTGPSNKSITQPTSDITDDGTRVTWGENETPANFIAYGPDKGFSSVVWTKFALVVVAIEAVVPSLRLVLFPAVLLVFLGFGLEVLSELIKYLGNRFSISVQAVYVGIGVLFAALSIVAGIIYFGTWVSSSDIRSLSFSVALIYALSGVIAGGIGFSNASVSPRYLLLPTVLLPLLSLPFMLLPDLPEFGPISQFLITFVPLAQAISIALLLPVGFTSGQGEYRQLLVLWGGILVASALHLLLRVVSLRVIKEELQVGMYQGIGYLLYPLALLVIGTPLYLFGLAIASTYDDHKTMGKFYLPW